MRLNKENALQLVQNQISVETVWMKHKTQLHIAILMKRGKVLEIASNSIGSRSKGAGFACRTIHAERAVIRKVGDNSQLNGAVLIVIRIAKGTKEVVNSEPCHSCRCHLEKCMREYGLKNVYYSV
jgi:deoxycytidylate deaminase